jgi:hypothetical protein
MSEIIFPGMSYEERAQLRHAARSAKDMMGFCMKAEQTNKDGKLVGPPGLWRPNSIPNEGYSTIWNVYFKSGTQPSGSGAFHIGLAASITSGYSLTTVIGDITAVSGGTGYAAQPLNTSTDWGITGNPMVATASQVTFTCASGTWTGAIGAYLYADVANKLIAYDAFAATRTLYAGDTLKVTLTLTREAAPE